MEYSSEKNAKQYVIDWCKKGFIKRRKMYDYIGVTIPTLEQTGVNPRNGRYVSTLADYLCYLIQVMPNAVEVLADLKQNNFQLYKDIVELLEVEDLIKLTSSDEDLLNSKNLEKVEKSLRNKLNKQIKVIIEEKNKTVD